MKAEELEIVVIAGILAVLSVLSFLTLLPKSGVFMLQILSLLFLCLLLRRSKLSRILFGEDRSWATWSIIVICLLFSSHAILTELLGSLDPGFLYAFFGGIDHTIDEQTTYAVGTLLVFVLAFIFTLRFNVKAPSVLSMMEEKGRPKHLDGYTIRTLLIFVVIVAFYILVFDIVLQWAGIIAGSATIIAIVAMLFTAVVKQSTSHISFKRFFLFIEHLNEDIFGGLVRLFHARITVLFGVAALLVFYPLSDLGAYILPYITNIPNGIINQLPLLSHTPLPVLAYETIHAQGAVIGLFGILAYVLNGIAAIMVLFLPALFWYRIFTKKTLTISPIGSAVFAASALCFLIAPAFSLARLAPTSETLVGVDIMTQSLTGAPVVLAIIAGIVAGVLVFIVAKKHPTQVSIGVIGLTLIFLFRYMALYFFDVWSGLLGNAVDFFKQATWSGFIDGFLFLCFLTISAIFYVGSLVAYFYEIWVSLWHEHHRRTRRVWTH